MKSLPDTDNRIIFPVVFMKGKFMEVKKYESEGA